MEKTKNNRPVHVVKLGQLEANIWRNETESGVHFNVTLRRRYSKEKGDEVTWHSSDSFYGESLGKLRELIEEAMNWLKMNPAA
jgi:hypothetical protein